MILTIMITAGALIEAYYWFVYFPRAWRDGSNREINDMKLVAREVYGVGKDKPHER